jgi:hypothetical protein
LTVREILIVGIAIPLVVGVVLLQIEYSFFTKSTSNLETEAKKIVEKVEGRNVESVPKPFVEPNVAELQTLLEVADKLSGTTSRNNEFQKIIRLAIDEKKPGFALLAADKMHGTNERNNQFMVILDKCIELKRFDLALKAADSHQGTTARNEAFKRIIDAGVKLRGKASNPVSVPTGRERHDSSIAVLASRII